MKGYLVGVLAVCLLTSTLSAQHANIGIKGGLNLYNVHNDNDFESDAKLGFHLGLLAHIHLSDQFAMQPELVFSTQGAQNSNNSDLKLNLNYLNIPIMFQYMFDNGFRLQAGPQVGLLVSAKRKAGDESVDVKDEYKGIDFGIGLGVGYVHPPTGFGIDARYNLGLSNINDNNLPYNSYNRGFQLGVFYLFNHKS